jgi:sugar lactone lactonase YvrE
MVRPRPDAGFSIVLAVASILVLITLGLALVSIVVEDSDLSVNHVRSNQAFYAAHAGVEYAVLKLSANPSWSGLALPGKTVGKGSFWVAPPDAVDENGNPLPAGQLRVVATGIVGDAKRAIEVHVAPGMITTYAGTGTNGYSGDGGAATLAKIKNPEGIALAPNGDLYICDSDNHAIRRVNFLTGVITTVAGTGNPGYSGDGAAATACKLSFPEDVAVLSNGDVYIADTGNHAIRKVTAATGTISTIAGTGNPGSSGDGGLATAAKLNSPRGLAIASNGDVYIGDRSNNKIRKIVAITGLISTFAGTGTAGYSGDGGLAALARLSTPQGLHLHSSGDLYFADSGNNVVRKIAAITGIITTVAGTGTAGYTGNGGLATLARLDSPEAVHLAPTGDIYIADTGNHAIRKVQAGSGIITTLAGTGAAGYAGDGGSATLAQFNRPRGIAVASTGVYFISDKNNHRIRKVTGALSVVAWVETRR